MKFITEEDLRDLYRKEPFTVYMPEPGTRLTPGARQFLADRGIRIPEKLAPGVKAGEKKAKPEVPQAKDDWRELKLGTKMKSVEALFLLSGEELLARDIHLAQQVIELKKSFSGLMKAVKSKSSAESINFTECTGITKDNMTNNLDDCFEITEFHMQLAKGKEILTLHRLRCALREIEPLILELCPAGSEENAFYQEILGKINQIINSLSQFICILLGGKKCQRTT